MGKGGLIVILGRQQLFTENTHTPILPLLRRKDTSAFLNVLRLWSWCSQPIGSARWR
jgi:hypothetical protein